MGVTIRNTATVRVTAEHIAAAGDDRIAWALPVELAIAELLGEPSAEVSIDGGDELGICVATIGTQSPTTLVTDLPAEANAWLNRRWGAGGHSPIPADELGEPFAFELELLPEWAARTLARSGS